MSIEIPDPLLREANCRAHEAGRKAVALLEAARRCDPLEIAISRQFHEVLDAARRYEEIQERQMKEATL